VTVRSGKAVMSVLLALLAIAGCGGGNDGDDGARPPAATGPADPEYAEKAEKVCGRALDQTRRLGRAFSKAKISPATPDLLAVTTEKLVRPGIAIRARMARQLRSLPPPERGGESVAAYLELFDPLEELSRQRLEAGLERDLDEVRRLEALMQELGEEQEAAARLAGLEACAANFVNAALESPAGG
jgi:hypothetical protein